MSAVPSPVDRDSFSPDLGQIKEVLQALSMAFENFIEFNTNNLTDDLPSPSYSDNNDRSSSSNSNRSSSSGSGSLKSSSPSPSKSSSDSGSGRKFYRFQRYFRRPSPSNDAFSESQKRKRNWETDEKVPPLDFGENGHSGKRSKSLVLTQELESLRLSSSPKSKNVSKVELELEEWADFDLNSRSFVEYGVITSISDLKKELDSFSCIGKIDEILKIICCFKSDSDGSLPVEYSRMNNWLKWAVLNESIESIKDSELSTKSLINRSFLLFSALKRLFGFIDWSDPELSFFINKYLISFLNSDKIRILNSAFTTTANRKSNYRRLEEFIGVVRVVNLFSRLPTNSNVFPLLLAHPDAFYQIIELLESLLEMNLNVFEFSAGQTTQINDDFSTFHLSCACVLLTVKIAERFQNSNNHLSDLIKSVKNRIP